MRDIWVISDTHFFHYNILTFKDNEGNYFRGDRFSCMEEMNETMVDNWNSVVKSGDIVYHLGDLHFGGADDMAILMPRLHGSKRLIVGNHDNIKYITKAGFFKKIQMWRMFPEFGLLLTHVPVHESSLGMKELVNVHGHIHQNLSPSEKHLNVSVEAINYTPINIEELRIR